LTRRAIVGFWRGLGSTMLVVKVHNQYR